MNFLDPELAAYNDTAFGALRMTLTPTRLDFAFVPTTGPALDSGSLPCPPSSGALRPPRSSPTVVAPQAQSGAPQAQRGHVRIVRPRTGAVYRRAPRRLEGRARGVRGPVRLTLVQRKGRHCKLLGRRRLRPAPCRTRRSLRAKGVSRWKLRLRPRSLPSGRYRLTARARGQDRRVVSTSVRFRVR